MSELKEGTKFDHGKVRLELLHPSFLFAVSMVLTKGAEKYAEWNWARGIAYSRCFGACMRHLWAWWGGQAPTSKNFAFGDIDAEWQFSHLWHAGCCVMFLICYEDWGYDKFDDRPRFPSADT